MTDKFHIILVEGKNLIAADSNGKSDPYCVIDCKQLKKKFTSKVISKTLNPTWNQSFELSGQNVIAQNVKITFNVFDKDLLSNDSLGNATLQLGELPQKGTDFWLPLQGKVLTTLNLTLWQVSSMVRSGSRSRD
jgi:Ca2+-dependent lipid-binding protein